MSPKNRAFRSSMTLAAAAAAAAAFLALAAGCSSSSPSPTPDAGASNEGALIGGEAPESAYRIPVVDLGAIDAGDCSNPFVDKEDLERSIRFAEAACVKKIVQAHGINLNQPILDAFGRQGDLALELALSDSAVFFGKERPALIPALLVSLGADPNARSSDKRSMLELAFDLDYGKYHSIAHYLVNLPSLKVDGSSGLYGTPLENAIRLKAKPLIHHLIRRGANVNLSTFPDTSPLHRALEQGLEGASLQLADAGANLSKTNRGSQTPLHVAIEARMSSAAKAFITKKAPLDARDSDAATPLHLAAESGNAEIAALLVRSSAALELKDSAGKTPLFAATEFDRPEIVEMLLGSHAVVSVADIQGRGLLHVAKRPETALRLIAARAPVNQTSQAGETALSVHAPLDHIEVVKSLVASGADLDWKDKRGRTLLHRAAESNSLRVADYLVTRGLSVEAADLSGETPLFGISTVEMLSLLAGAHADVNRLNHAKQSALLKHVTRGDLPLVTAFLDRGADLRWGRDQRTSYLIHLLRGARPMPSEQAEWLVSLTRLFLERGIDSTQRDAFGNLAIHVLHLNPWIVRADVLLDLCKTFKDLGTDVSARDAQGLSLKDYLVALEAETAQTYKTARAEAEAKNDAAALERLKQTYEPILQRLKRAMETLSG
jgi:ankyrin repeat protein